MPKIEGFKETQRCSGDCCRAFFLPLSPLEVEHQRKLLEIGKHKFIDDHKVLPMLIFVRSEHTRKKTVYRYTCKWLDRETGSCTNYEDRPDMCRNFPYRVESLKPSGACKEFRGCTMRGTCPKPKS